MRLQEMFNLSLAFNVVGGIFLFACILGIHSRDAVIKAQDELIEQLEKDLK